ncbi:hypothetical protein QFC22_001622 [Naganishia vaughanmartiniae]|uniref:Uncharacterized protein n=1 Tax=Naganishia vaughanmartiniae TaxID=1424756 RepID=A0ACC2XJ62_9TREE|nr:hypothetical protein QFC22_001622 [Naganishia vaughanmartiniae]
MSAALSLPTSRAGGIPLALAVAAGKSGAAAAAAAAGAAGRRIALDDAEQSERKLQKLVLPPIAPLLPAGVVGSAAGVEGEEMTVGDLDAVSDDEDDEGGLLAPGKGGDAEGGKMQVDDAVDDDRGGEGEEEDPLDAFMKENVKQVQTIDKEDLAQQGDAKNPKKSTTSRENLADVDDQNVPSDDGEDGENGNGNGPMTAEDILALAAKKAKKKDLPAAAHSKIAYEPFEKRFYHPSTETREMDEEEVELMRIEMDGIKIRGVGCPKPVRNWGAFGLPAGW